MQADKCGQTRQEHCIYHPDFVLVRIHGGEGQPMCQVRVLREILEICPGGEDGEDAATNQSFYFELFCLLFIYHMA